MNFALDICWSIVSLIRVASLGATLLGVAVFGKNFIGINARAAQTDSAEIPDESWRGPGAVNGFKLMGLGFALLLVSFFIGALLPPRL